MRNTIVGTGASSKVILKKKIVNGHDSCSEKHAVVPETVAAAKYIAQ